MVVFVKFYENVKVARIQVFSFDYGTEDTYTPDP
jgi:hypothetical protein